MVLIKIDRKSIRKNPNVGRTQQKVAGARNTTFTCKGELPVYMKDEDSIIITEWSIGDGVKEYKGIITDESIIEKIYNDELFKENGKNITIETSQDWNTVTFPPEPKYFYKYKNTKVKCKECKHKFMSNEFKEFDWDDNYSYTITGCPKCENWDCCNIEYEKIEDVKIKVTPK